MMLMLNEIIIKATRTIEKTNQKRSDLTYITKFLNITKDKKASNTCILNLQIL